MSVNISEETYEILEKLKYKYRYASLDEVIRKLAEQAIAPGVSRETNAVLLPAPEVKTRHIPSVTKNIVKKRSEDKCAYTNPKTGEECSENQRLEFDHIHPFSKGGPHLPENLRLLCSHHNKHVWNTEQKQI